MIDEQQVPPQEAEATVPSVYADLLEPEATVPSAYAGLLEAGVPAGGGMPEAGALLATADSDRDEIVAFA